MCGMNSKPKIISVVPCKINLVARLNFQARSFYKVKGVLGSGRHALCAFRVARIASNSSRGFGAPCGSGQPARGVVANQGTLSGLCV